MTNVVTASRENVDWAIGVIDQALAGEEIDAHDAFKAGAVLSVVSIAAFDLAEEVKRLKNELSLSGVVDTMAKFVAEIERLEAQNRALVAAVRPVIEAVDSGEGQAPDSLGWTVYEVALTRQQVEALRAAMEERR